MWWGYIDDPFTDDYDTVRSPLFTFDEPRGKHRSYHVSDRACEFQCPKDTFVSPFQILFL